jgi:hypothetical protein
LVVAEVWAMVRSITMTMLRKHLAEAKHVYKIHKRFSMISYNLYINIWYIYIWINTIQLIHISYIYTYMW